jgi:AcrR family transcriptional regulator
MTHVTDHVKRLSRAEQQEQTRLALLDAAIELFIERGVEATSIEEVTTRAGFTRGAFYSNFESKDELFLGACRRFLELLHAAARPPAGAERSDAGAAYSERLTRLRSVTTDSASLFLAEISLYAIRRPELLEEVAAMHREQLAPAIDFVSALLSRAGIDKPSVPVETLANLAQSLTFGLHLFGRVDPSIAAEKSLAAGMDLIIKGLARG